MARKKTTPRPKDALVLNTRLVAAAFVGITEQVRMTVTPTCYRIWVNCGDKLDPMYEYARTANGLKAARATYNALAEEHLELFCNESPDLN